MPSLNFDVEKDEFQRFYESEREILDKAREKLASLLEDITRDLKSIEVFSITSRIKTREECISKFIRKYRTDLEASRVPYAIKDHITDLLGLRIVCLYEADIPIVESALARELNVIGKTNKSSILEEQEATFGYRGLHLDAMLDDNRSKMQEYRVCARLSFEVQVRSLIQDAWSSIDHRIKYKRSIPSDLRRRVNALAALFEIAEREFKAIRDATLLESLAYSNSYESIEKETTLAAEPAFQNTKRQTASRVLDAFSFLRIARHFFPDFDFEGRRVDGFVAEVLQLEPAISPGRFNTYMKSSISDVKKYADDFRREKGSSMNPFTIIRHCLYASNKEVYDAVLTKNVKSRFDGWSQGQTQSPTKAP